MDLSLAASNSAAEDQAAPPYRKPPLPSLWQTSSCSSRFSPTRETTTSSIVCSTASLASRSASVDFNLGRTAGSLTGKNGGAGVLAPSLEVCTESPGFESLTEKMDDGGNLTAESTSSPLVATLRESVASRSTIIVKRRGKKEIGIFPPFLTSLDRSGRPRFFLMKERSGGRLRMYTVQNEVPGMVRSYGTDGELKMKFSVL